MKGVTSGAIESPQRILMYGVEGVGKSTWAASTPSPIFVSTEGGVEHMAVDRLDGTSTYDGCTKAISLLLREEHTYHTLVIDTVDWLSRMVDTHVCEKNRWSSLEDPGYGKGPAAAHDEWRPLLALIGRVRAERGMHVVMVGHCEVKRHKDPCGDEYDRYGLKLPPKTSAMLREWSDSVLFAQFDTVVRKRDGRAIGVSSGERIIHTERTAAWDAKNRGGMPAKVGMDYAFFNGVSEAEYEAALASLPEDRRVKAAAWVDGHSSKISAKRKVIEMSKAKTEEE